MTVDVSGERGEIRVYHLDLPKPPRTGGAGAAGHCALLTAPEIAAGELARRAPDGSVLRETCRVEEEPS